MNATASEPTLRPLLKHLCAAAPGLFREPAGLLHHPFIVPGAAYSHELWDWDSYWTTLGILDLSRASGDAALHARALRYGHGSLRNFIEHQHPCGGMPIMMRSDNADVFGCFNDEGLERNQAKPVFGQFALALAEAETGADARREIAALALPALDRFYAYWGSRYLHAPTGLLVWGSDVGIGVDNDPSTYGRPHFSSANLLLNCLFYADLVAAASLAERFGGTPAHAALAPRWRARAEALAESIRTHCWDARDGCFYSLDVQCVDDRAKLIAWAAPGMPLTWSALPLRIRSFTSFLPLWCGIATAEQAELMRRQAIDPVTFGAAHGVRSLARNETLFSLAPSCNPSNWLGPIWILANYLVWRGLARYGFAEEAATLAAQTVALLEADIEAHGATHEYYDPETGRPLMNKGFLSWNLLAAAMAPPPAGY